MDFLFTSVNLTILENTTMGDPLCVNVTILADDTLEDNETFTVSIMSLSDNSDVLEPSDITITIVDEDGMCVHVCVCVNVCVCV